MFIVGREDLHCEFEARRADRFDDPIEGRGRVPAFPTCDYWLSSAQALSKLALREAGTDARLLDDPSPPHGENHIRNGIGLMP